MAMSECDTLKVDVPVGFLLPEAREILVSVDRVAEAPLSIRLRLIPAETDGMTDIGACPSRSSDDTPLPTRRLSRKAADHELLEPEMGGSD
jgi:hypothetical protein